MPGAWEWILIFMIGLLLLGPGIFMRAGSSLGHGVGAFKKAIKDGEKSNEPPAT